MRILDRQRYWAFLKAYVVSFVSLVGLYIVIDAFTNLDEFLKVSDTTVELFQHMGWFYLVRISFFYDRLCGVITMMAAIFTVTWMTKNNELLAMLAAGVSTRRAIVPVLVSSVMVSTLAILNQEFLIPRVADELQMTHDDDGERPVRAGNRYDLNDIQINGETGDRGQKTIEPFHALLPVSRFGGLWSLEAKVARYIPETDIPVPLPTAAGCCGALGFRLANAVSDGQLLFHARSTRQNRLVSQAQGDAPPPPGDVFFFRSSVTFTNITRNPDWYQFAPTPDLVRAVTDPSSPSEGVQVGVFLHGRLDPTDHLARAAVPEPAAGPGRRGSQYVHQFRLVAGNLGAVLRDEFLARVPREQPGFFARACRLAADHGLRVVGGGSLGYDSHLKSGGFRRDGKPLPSWHEQPDVFRSRKIRRLPRHF